MGILFDKTKRINKTISSVILLAVLFSGMFLVNTRKAHAIMGAGDTVIEVGPNAFFNKITSLQQWIATKSQLISEVLQKLTAMDTRALVLKEYVLDPILWGLAKNIMKDFIGGVVDWSRTGALTGIPGVPMLGTSEGGPLFITDLKKLLWDGVYQGSGIFINLYNRPEIHELIPEPWVGEVGKALLRDRINIVSYTFPVSTLHEDIATQEGMARFMHTFYDPETGFGGWDAWLSLFDKPTNMPMGLYRELSSEMKVQAFSFREQLETEAQMDSGFIGEKRCEDRIEGPAGTYCTKWITESPGTWVEKQTGETTTSELRSFENADEISEMIITLLSSLASSLIFDQTLLGGTFDPWIEFDERDPLGDYAPFDPCARPEDWDDGVDGEWLNPCDPYQSWEDPEPADPNSEGYKEWDDSMLPPFATPPPIEVKIVDPLENNDAVRVFMTGSGP